MKKLKLVILGIILLASVNSFAECYGCSWQKAGKKGTFYEGSRRDGGTSCGIICLYCDPPEQ